MISDMNKKEIFRLYYPRVMRKFDKSLAKTISEVFETL